MRFGVHIPTCIEGMMYPVPFARPEDVLPTARLCERLGFKLTRDLEDGTVKAEMTLA